MSDKTYDFRISQPACVRAIEAYKKMEERMEAEQENTENIFKSENIMWQGASRDSTNDFMHGFFHDGLFNITYENVKAMRVCLEEALPQINGLLARCEGFIDQLQCDSYVEPVKPVEDDSTEWNSGILALNYDYIPKILDLCDAILAKNTTLTMALASVISGCSSLLDGTDEDLQELTEASHMLMRIGNFKESFSLFASGVQDLNVDMMIRLKAIAVTGGTSGGGFSQEEAALAAEYFTDYDDISTVREIARRIFKKNASEWSEAEIDFIARTWDYAIQNGQTKIIEMYTKEMFVETYMELQGQEESEQSLWTWDYYLKGDDKKIDLIMSRLDPKTQGTAYYTLNRLKYLQSDCLTISQKNPDLSKCGSYDISVEYVDGSIQILIDTSVETGRKLKENSYEVGITLCDMNDVIDVDQEQKLINKLFFSQEQIEAMKLSAVTDADISMLQELSAGNYEAAFLIDPGELSERTQISLTLFANQIVSIAEGKGSSPEEATDFINAILHISPERCGNRGNNTIDDYLKILSSTSMMLLDYEMQLCTPVLSDDTPSGELDALEAEWRKLYVLYGLWVMLEEATASEYFHNLDSDYYYGFYTYKVDKLKIYYEFSKIKMELGVYTQEGEIAVHMIDDDANGPVDQVQPIIIDPNETSSQVNTQLLRVERQELYNEMELKKAEALFDATVSCLKSFPKLEVTLKGLKSFYNGDVSGMLSNGGKAADNILKTGNKYGGMMDFASRILGFNQIIQEFGKKLKENGDTYIKTTMGSGVSGEVGSGEERKKFAINYGIYNPHIIVRLNTWSEQGLCGLLGIEVSSEEKSKQLDAIATEIGYIEGGYNYDNFYKNYKESNEENTIDMEELQLCLNLLLYGNDFDGDGNIDCEKKIYEMDPAVIMEAISCIDRNIPDDIPSINNEILKMLRHHSCLDFL